MAYAPLQIKPNIKTQRTLSPLSRKGLDNLNAPQFLTPENAQKIENYLLTAGGRLEKRGGLDNLFTVAGANPIYMAEKYTSSIYIYAYSDKVVAYDKDAETHTTIKTYSAASTVYSGQRYGDYFFVTNGTDNPGRISRTLDYDGQTGNFTVGSKITGGTSGATAIILEDSDSGATGTLTLGSISGTFQDNEALTDAATGVAVVDGTLDWTFTSVTAAPICNILKVIGNRLFAGNLLSDPTAVKYSDADDGTNPPFTDWTVATGSADPGLINFRNAGPVNSIEALGDNVVVFAENGKWSFVIDTIDSAGTLTKIDRTQLSRLDLGGSSGSILTPYGLFYINERGLWRLVSVGQNDIPFSEQEGFESILLGNDYFDDITLTNADIAYSQKYNTLLITCAKDSSTNNHIIAYNLTNGAFFIFKGWTINRFLDDDGVLYGASSTTTTIWKLFEGTDDDGNDIYTSYEQELNVGGLGANKELRKVYMQGFLSSSTVINVAFDIYTREGNKISDKLKYTWSADSTAGFADGYAEASWGVSSWGADTDTGGLTENFAGGGHKIKNFNRIILKLNEQSKVSHQLTWISLETREKSEIRRRNLVKVS